MGAKNVRDKKAFVSYDDSPSTSGIESEVLMCLDLPDSRRRITPSPAPEPIAIIKESYSITPVFNEMLDNNKPHKVSTLFQWSGDARTAYIAGTFNNWTKIPMIRSHGNFAAVVELPEGKHEYKFFIDDKWTCDPNKEIKSNDLGTENNVIEVKPSDFEVFEALAVDSMTPGQSSVSGSPPGNYSQNIPRQQLHEVNQHRSGPPDLPPHLTNFLLNQEVAKHFEPNLLLEPNPVMLNHLFALSITDGVMLLSVTNRYRKKYVTTLLFQPIDP